MKKLEIPNMNSNNKEIIEAIRKINARLKSIDGVKVILFTSCNEADGKSCLLMNCAERLAKSGERVLVIDAAFKSLNVSNRLWSNTDDINQNIGLTEFLKGRCKMGDIIYSSSCPGLYFSISGKIDENASYLLEKKSVRRFFETAKENFDFVFVDSRAISESADAFVLSAMCDGVIMVVSVGNTHINLVKSYLGEIEKTGVKLLGVIANKL